MRRYYFWIHARDENGKSYLIFGSDKDENDARQKGLELLGGQDFDIKRYPTRDLATASSFLRGKRLESTHSLSESHKRIGHNKSIKHLRQRRTTGGM